MHLRLRTALALALAASVLLACGAATDGAVAEGEALRQADVLTDGGALPPDAGFPLRIMSANTTSGNDQSYDPGEGKRMFQGLKPDVVLIQELRVGANTEGDLRAFVDSAFGSDFAVFRESTGNLPNGIISRYPIEQSGSWRDPRVGNRGFAWAKIAVPGAHPLWTVSLHLLTSSAANRNAEAAAIVTQVRAVIPPSDYLVIGGDLNTGSRGEACVLTLAQVVTTAAPYPEDARHNPNTSGARSKPHDWVMPDAKLAALQVPTQVGAQTFPAGLVFDSRVFAPLVDAPPILPGDSAAANMQHMPVVKDFLLPR